MSLLLLGNAVSMVGCIIMVAIGFLKKKSHILAAQSVQCLFMGFGNLILGGVSGFVANIVSVIRNLVFAKWQPNLALKIGFILLQFLLSVSSLSSGWIAWLPILAAAVFTWFLDTKSEELLKIVIIGTMVLWLIYDIYYRNYVASFFDVLTILSNTMGFFMIRKANKTT